jgi:hypothetical protein
VVDPIADLDRTGIDCKPSLSRFLLSPEGFFSPPDLDIRRRAGASSEATRSQVTVGKPDKLVGTCFISKEPDGRGDVELKRIKRSRGRSRPHAFRMGYATGGPEQLGQFPFGQALTREVSDRPSARQRLFE